MTFDVDYLIIGSGFGGSVSALRLSEKGYRVLVVERGKRYRAEDFPKSNWNLRRYLWAPRLWCYGIQAITFLRDVMILHGAGVGGGSLVYANTLLVPPPRVFDSPRWGPFRDFQATLAQHYETAKRMLGATPAPFLGRTDELLREVAEDMGRGDTFHRTQVGVYFGKPGEEHLDPYFGGEGPPRKGCVLCGGCMVGCRHEAKNSLDKNYLFLAEGRGAKILAEHEALDIRPLDGGGYEVLLQKVTDPIFKRKRRVRARGVVVAAGVLGSVPLLFACKERGALRISDALGTYVRTNSEALVGVTDDDGSADHSKGIAIASGFSPDDDTHIEMVRYGAGQDFMGLLSTVLVDGGSVPRWISWLGQVVSHPWQTLRMASPLGFARRSAILLVMQPVENFMSLVRRRRWWWPFGKGLSSQWQSSDPVPKVLPAANQTARALAARMGGQPRGVLPEILFNLSSTAHILGGCPMGEGPDTGVIDFSGRVFGHDDLFVIDGSVIPANLSVNPSLTITALAEAFMAQVPPKDVP